MPWTDEEWEKWEWLTNPSPGDPGTFDREKHLREQFLSAVEQDPELKVERQDANKVYDLLLQQLKLVGISLQPHELKEQMKAGSLATEAPEEFEPPSDELAKPMSSRGVELATHLENLHEEWSSDSNGTPPLGPQWDSTEKTLEEKVAEADPADAIAVAAAHEIQKEKQQRREDRKAKDVEKASEQVIRWGPITKQGLNTFMASFGQVSTPHPGAMNLGDLVNYACGLEDTTCIPDRDNYPTELLSTIEYIRILHFKWKIVDMEDFDWWLDHEWGPLFALPPFFGILICNPSCNHISYFIQWSNLSTLQPHAQEPLQPEPGQDDA